MESTEGQGASKGRGIGYRTLIMAAAAIIVIAGLKTAGSVLVPVLLAAFLAVLSYPPIAWLQKRKLPDWAAVLVVFSGVLVTFVLISVYIGASIRDFTGNLPEYQAGVLDQIRPLLAWLSGYGIEVSAEVITEQLNTGRVMTWFAGALSTASSVLSDTLFVLLTTIFIILEATGLPKKIAMAMGTEEGELGRFSGVLDKLRAYLSIKTQVSLLTGFLAGLLVFVVGVEYAALWALLAFLLNFVPTLGSIIAALPAVVMALIQFGWERAAIVGGGYLVINLVIGNVIEPKLMGRRLGLSTLVVFLSLVFWGFVWGPLGMLLCVPLTMLVKILLESSDDLQWLAVLLGSGAETRERVRLTNVPPPPTEPPEPEEEAA